MCASLEGAGRQLQSEQAEMISACGAYTRDRAEKSNLEFCRFSFFFLIYFFFKYGLALVILCKRQEG
jgi:hypothetical protein